MTRCTTLVSGITGFVGSHLAAELLHRRPDMDIICIVRPGSSTQPRTRAIAAIEAALGVQERTLAEPDWGRRIFILEASMETLSQRLREVSGELPVANVESVWHCASSTLYESTSSVDLHEVNVEGTRSILEVCNELGCPVFNYVSTAYVAGRRDGVIPETLPDAGTEYNNGYEVTKSAAETLVDAFSRQNGLSFRIFRPSIIIGHSATHRSNTDGGLNKLIDAALKTRRMVLQRNPLYFLKKSIFNIHLREDSLFNVIPIDHVVDDMLAIDAGGSEASGMIYHITGENQICIADAMHAFSSAFGINVECHGELAEMDKVETAFDRSIGQFKTYLSSTKLFERANEGRCGIVPPHRAWQPDTGLMERLVQARREETDV